MMHIMPLFEAIVSGGNGGSERWREIEDEISRNSVLHRRAADVHGHSVNMGILVMLVGLLAPLVTRNTGAADYRLLLAMAVTSVVYPGGLFLQFLGLNPAGELVSAIGAAGAVIYACDAVYPAFDGRGFSDRLRLS